MKRLFLILLVLSQGILSCSSEDDPQEPQAETEKENEGPEDENEEEEPLHLSFELTGEYKNLQNTESPKDLIGIQVYDLNADEAYAFVLADELSALSLEVEKEKTYQIITSYIRNGKDLIRSENGHWLQPFGLSDGSLPDLNKFIYSSFVTFAGLNNPEIEMTQEEAQVFLPIDRYHAQEEVAIQNDSEEVGIDLKRLVFGVDLHIDLGEATLFEEVLFTIGPPGSAGRTYLIGLENGQGSLQLPFLSLAVPDGTLTAALAEGYTEEVTLSLGTEEEPERFVHETITASPNSHLDLGFTSKEGHPNIYFELEEGELIPEDGSLYEY